MTPAYLHVLLGYRGFFLVGAVVEGKAGGASSDSMAIILRRFGGERVMIPAVWILFYLFVL